MIYEKLKLNGFTKVYINNVSFDSENINQLSFNNKTFQEKYEKFKIELFDKLKNKSYFPIYRMADGEFIFALGRIYGLGFLSLLRHFFSKWAIKTCWGEKYTKRERKSAFNSYVDAIRNVAQNGKLAIHLTEFVGIPSYQEYNIKLLNWFQTHNILLNDDNYIPFYFVYAFFSDEENKMHMFNKKNILVFSSFDENKKDMLKKNLHKYEPNNIEFYEISSDKSLLEKINLNEFKMSPDISLIAGGIGASNILFQLKDSKSVAIDCGMALEVLIDPTLSKKRPFLQYFEN